MRSGLVAAIVILSSVLCVAEKPKTYQAEYTCSRDALLQALSQVVADNAWHFDLRDEQHGDFRIGVPKTPLWQGKLVVNVSSVDAQHQRVTIFREKSGTVGAKKVAQTLMDGLDRAIQSKS